MTERFLHASYSVELDPENGDAQLAALKEALPARQARRMSPLGIMANHVLERMPLTVDTVLIYATTYTESLALEAFLGSFPYPSPTHFQTSIHPGGIEQALILKQQPVAAFYPIAGGERILEQAFRLACEDERPDVIVVAGEESASWLADLGAASRHSFAWALHLTARPRDARAILGLREGNPDPNRDGETPGLLEFGRRLRAREDLAWNGPAGSFSWKWT